VTIMAQSHCSLPNASAKLVIARSYLATFLVIIIWSFVTTHAAVGASTASANAKVFFLNLKDGDTVPANLTVRFGAANIDIVPAGTPKTNSGHFHLLIDIGLPPANQPIPADFNHLHLGKGQTEAEIALTAGPHTLQLLLGDHEHIPHTPPVVSEIVHIFVDPATVEQARTPAAPGAKVFFVDLTDGATVGPKTTIKFGLSGMELAPAGTNKPISGHHHLLIDTPLPPLDREIPSDLNHLHFGRAQTQVELTLTPGEHTLQLLLGDYQHIPHDPPIVSKVVRVHVVGSADVPVASLETWERQPSPPDAAVYFIYPHDGDIIYPNSTIRFGLRNMGVAPAGVRKPDTGHHHLVVDADTPPPNKPISSDLNHIHLSGGQTEKKIKLTPGEHTLQLIFADDQHVPHDPPVMSERIKVHVLARRVHRKLRGS